MPKLISWFKNNFWTLAVVFLLVFIPLYPKIPLLHVIRTWVYIRLEDFFVAVVVGLFLLWQLRQKRLPQTPLTIPTLVYWGVGLLVLANSLIFIGPKLEGFFPHLALLHYLRRLEYMLVFFVAYAAVRKQGNALKAIIWALGLTVVGIVIYGLGQKFLGWPAFLTMNEEFAKGIPLRLPPTARIASTFGGHYDLAAYLVFVIPILGSLVFGLRRFWEKLVFFLFALGAFVLLLFTASRISFGVYLVAITAMLIWQKKKWLMLPVVVGSFLLMNFVSGTSERFYKTFRFSDIVIDLSTGKPIGTLDKLQGVSAVIAKIESPAEESLPKGSGFVGLPPVAAGPAKPVKTIRTVELFSSKDLATGSGEVATISGSFLIQKALVYDISITTRFQGQWPKAATAFKRSVLLGSGFSTLSLAADGDYHRMLGETGIFGSIAFLGVFLMAFVVFRTRKDELDSLPRTFVVGVFAGLVGLLLNAILIDVFEASKVAFTLWLMLGVALALLAAKPLRNLSYGKTLWRVFTHPVAYAAYLILAIFIVYNSALSGYFVGDDFTWLRWAAQSSLRDVLEYFTKASGFFYRPLPKLWYFILFSLFWLKPGAYHLLSLVLLAIITVMLYLLMLKLKIKKLLAWLFSLLFAVLAIHHENVFWISGASSLLSGALLLGALVTYVHIWTARGRQSWLKEIWALLLLFGAMVSYDGMLIAPAVVVTAGFFIFRQRRLSLVLPLLLMPLYWWIRVSSGALLPSGDYGYRQATLVVNSVANGVGYLLAIILGPRVIEGLATLREWLRAQKLLFSLLAIALTAGVGWWLVKLRRVLGQYQEALAWFACFFLALVPYLGLGGMAERYSLIASIFLILSLASLVNRLWQAGMSEKYKVGIVLLLAAVTFWNIRETLRLGGDWDKASEISEQTLLTLKKGYFPLTSPRSFVFVNMPIRYGRAWVFPTGLTDALWHMFRTSPYEAVAVSDIAQAFQYQSKLGAIEVLTFTDYKVKKALREVKIIEEEINGQK